MLSPCAGSRRTADCPRSGDPLLPATGGRGSPPAINAVRARRAEAPEEAEINGGWLSGRGSWHTTRARPRQEQPVSGTREDAADRTGAPGRRAQANGRTALCREQSWPRSAAAARTAASLGAAAPGIPGPRVPKPAVTGACLDLTLTPGALCSGARDTTLAENHRVFTRTDTRQGLSPPAQAEARPRQVRAKTPGCSQLL